MLSPFRVLSPAGARGRLSIFIFHRVLPQADPYLPYEPGADWFDQIVGFISRFFRVLPFSEAAQALARGKLPAATACITFDDGYADNFEIAVPILRRHGVPATFFIATDYIDGGRMWNDVVIEAVAAAPAGRLDWSDLGLGAVELGDVASRFQAYRQLQEELKYLHPQRRDALAAEMARRAGLPPTSRLMMTREQVRRMPGEGMEVGGHTMGHPILACVDEAEARRQIGGGREELAGWLGFAPRVFAYPDGIPVRDYTERDVRLVRSAGYEAAVSTAQGAARTGDDVHQLPRFTPWDRTVPRFAVRSALNLLRGDPHVRVPMPLEAS
jgi:peptidoglycan/xylan/chitin deacetylase (PgdA/CDA1 family)